MLLIRLIIGSWRKRIKLQRNVLGSADCGIPVKGIQKTLLSVCPVATKYLEVEVLVLGALLDVCASRLC